jgi:hypothetical protein
VPEDEKIRQLSKKKIFKFTSTTLLITLGNALSGLRRRLNNDNDTNALSAVKILSFDERTYAANVAIPT